MPAPPDFAEFYAATYPRLLTQLFAFVGDRAEAQDLMQEAYTRAFARWAKVSSFEDPIGWVRRVAWNLAISRWRRTKRLLHLRRDLLPGDVDGPDGLSLDVVRAMAQLSAAHRQAAVLHYLADFSVREIAEFIGAPEGTVKARLHRARAALSRLLNADEERVIRDGAVPATTGPHDNGCGGIEALLATGKPVPTAIPRSVQDSADPSIALSAFFGRTADPIST
jgi:RNA polymerase sigma-70 factor (ECF subfamily)